MWSLLTRLIRIFGPMTIDFYLGDRSSREDSQQYWSRYHNPEQFIFIFRTDQVVKLSNKIGQGIRTQENWLLFLGQSKLWSFPKILIRVSEPRTIDLYFWTEQVVKISNNIDQGISTQDILFYFWDRSSREDFQQYWSGYQNPGRIMFIFGTD